MAGRQGHSTPIQQVSKQRTQGGVEMHAQQRTAHVRSQAHIRRGTVIVTTWMICLPSGISFSTLVAKPPTPRVNMLELNAPYRAYERHRIRVAICCIHDDDIAGSIVGGEDNHPARSPERYALRE